MSITFKRHYRFIVLLIIILISLLAIGSTRIISYNFGSNDYIEVKGKNYNNDIALFDTTVIHKIEVGLSAKDYDLMVETYQEASEKDYFRTYVTIDGVTIPDVGIRLKGNLTLRQTLGGNGNGQEMGGPGGNGGAGMPGGSHVFDVETMDLDNLRLPPFIELPENWDTQSDDEKRIFLKEAFVAMDKGGGMPGGSMAGGNMEGDGGNPPYLIKFDEFISGQTYESVSELAVRIGSDDSLLGEPVAYALHGAMGQVVPRTSFAVVDIGDNETSLYVLAEHLDGKYIKRNFPDEDGILYKAGNFVGFEYLGEDPTLYAEKYEQKTNKGDDDMSQLIAFLKFASESSDAEFEAKLGDWIDIDSMVRMMVLDNLLQNNDSFVGMGSNYFLFYSKTNAQFTILSWDQNLALGGMGKMGGGMKDRNNNAEVTDEDGQDDVMQEWMKEGGFDGKQGGGGGSSKNMLKDRFMANEKFKAIYDSEYARIRQEIFEDGLGIKTVEQLSKPFIEFNAAKNIIKQDDYLKQVEEKKNFFDN